MTIFSLLRKLPIAGTVIWLANSYAYSGDARSNKHFAPIKLWFKAYFLNLVAAAFLTAISLLPLTSSLINHILCGSEIMKTLAGFSANPGALIVSIFPNVLGLGIGIYALLFALDISFVRQMHLKLNEARESGKREYGSVLMLNADMALPLTILLIGITVGIFAQIFPTNLSLQVSTWVLFWYGIIVMLEIIALLFSLVDNSLLEKAKDPDEQKQKI